MSVVVLNGEFYELLNGTWHKQLTSPSDMDCFWIPIENPELIRQVQLKMACDRLELEFDEDD